MTLPLYPSRAGLGNQNTGYQELRPASHNHNKTQSKQRRHSWSTPPPHIRPHGSHGNSLSSLTASSLNLAKNITFGSHQLHFTKGSSKAAKVATVAGLIRTGGGVLNKILLLTKRAAALSDSAVTRSVAFTRSLHALRGIAFVTQGLTFAKDAATGSWQAVKDIVAHKKRGETQQLLKDWNPETRSHSGSKAEELRLQQLTSGKGPDLTRSRSKTAADRLTNLKDLAITGLGITSSALQIAGGTSATAAKALPGVAIAANTIVAIQSGIRAGIQIAALNNLTSAETKTSDPLLKALAGHIKNERTIKARKYLLNTAVNTFSAGASIALAASGIGAPAALIASGAIGTAAAVGTMAFDGLHNRKLAKSREKSQHLMSLGHPLDAIAKSNIGVAERAFLLRLRTSQGNDLKESVAFLRNLGVTENTIKKLQLAPEVAAMKSLQQVIYNDKLKFKGLMLKQTGATLLHISGLTALGKKIKTGSQWLVGKIRNYNQTRLGNSLRLKNVLFHSEKERQPATPPPTFNDYYQRRHTL